MQVRYADPDAEDEHDEVFLLELGPDGRRLRQVAIEPDGSATAEGPDDWPFNPPFDMYDPRLAAMQITDSQFEAAWSKCEGDPGTVDRSTRATCTCGAEGTQAVTPTMPVSSTDGQRGRARPCTEPAPAPASPVPDRVL